MNGSARAIVDYLGVFESDITAVAEDVEIVLAPPSLYLSKLGDAKSSERIHLAAQNVAAQQDGAYTGEISSGMLSDAGVAYSLVGHSERRSLFGETDAVVVEKVARLLEQGIRPILCVGETLEERESGNAQRVVEAQLNAVIRAYEEVQLSGLVVAYEPVWAIGTGKTATPGVAQEMHAAIRACMAETMPALAARCPLLYGGSVNSANAAELFAQEDIDGGLVGGASLKPEEFLIICQSIG